MTVYTEPAGNVIGDFIRAELEVAGVVEMMTDLESVSPLSFCFIILDEISYIFTGSEPFSTPLPPALLVGASPSSFAIQQIEHAFGSHFDVSASALGMTIID